MVVVPMAQVWKRGLVGTLGKDQRQRDARDRTARSPARPSCSCHGAYYARQAATLADGEAMLFGGGGEAIKTVVPELSQADPPLRGRGKPPRPTRLAGRRAQARAARADRARRANAPFSLDPDRPRPTDHRGADRRAAARPRDWLISAGSPTRWAFEIDDARPADRAVRAGVIRQRPNTRGGRGPSVCGRAVAFRPPSCKWLILPSASLAAGTSSQQNARVEVHESKTL